MIRITAMCPQCGRVNLTGDEVTLVVNPHQGSACYLFDCLGCARQVVKAVPRTVATAMSLLQISTWTVPAEVPEREQPTGERPPITIDDLLDTMLWLRKNDDLSDSDLRARRSGRPRHSAAS
jgi:hypothetical protein